MVCGLPGAPTAWPAVWIETSSGYDSTVQSCDTVLALSAENSLAPQAWQLGEETH